MPEDLRAIIAANSPRKKQVDADFAHERSSAHDRLYSTYGSTPVPSLANTGNFGSSLPLSGTWNAADQEAPQVWSCPHVHADNELTVGSQGRAVDACWFLGWCVGSALGWTHLQSVAVSAPAGASWGGLLMLVPDTAACRKGWGRSPCWTWCCLLASSSTEQ